MPTPIHDRDFSTAREMLIGPWQSLESQIANAVAAERERCARAAEWYGNVENFTAAQVAARIRSGK